MSTSLIKWILAVLAVAGLIHFNLFEHLREDWLSYGILVLFPWPIGFYLMKHDALNQCSMLAVIEIYFIVFCLLFC